MEGHNFVHGMAFDMHQQELTLDFKLCTVHTLSLSGTTIAGHKPIFSHILAQIKTQNYNLLVFDIRSDDLDPTRHKIINVQNLARELVSRAQELAKNYSN